MYCLGIDPGLKGAIAIISDDYINVLDTPVDTIKKGKNKKTEYMPSVMASIIKHRHVDHCFIEKVHSMPKQGVASSFNFGRGYGIWIGILSALEIPYTEVTPQEWKKEMMKGMKDKDAARIRAQQLFPQLLNRLERKKDVDRAEALLICEYGRRTLHVFD